MSWTKTFQLQLSISYYMLLMHHYYHYHYHLDHPHPHIFSLKESKLHTGLRLMDFQHLPFLHLILPIYTMLFFYLTLLLTNSISSTTVKTMLSIGGGGDNATVFSNMVSPAIFINSSIEIAPEYGFDGIDLDWEFPQNGSDMMNLGLLYNEWYNALPNDAIIPKIPRLLLTSAVYFAAKIPNSNINKYVDWISPMCFDYYGSWNNATGEHAALYDPNSDLSTSFGLHSWMDSGMQPEKIVMGLALYGHTWTLQDPNVNGIGAPTSSVVGPGNGILSYSQVMDFNWANNAIVKFDIESSSFYSYAGVSWSGYDDISSVSLKVQFAKANDLAGYFVWAIGDDQDWALSKQAQLFGSAYETWGT